MKDAGPMQDDQQIDQMIGQLLRVGVIVAATVIFVGAVMFLFRHGSDRPDYHVFSMLPQELRSPVGIIRLALHGDSMGVMQLGMLLLIAVPIARVVLSVFAFLVRKDYLYVAIAGIVLCVLLYSLIPH